MSCGSTPCPSPLFFSCQAVRRFILDILNFCEAGQRALTVPSGHLTNSAERARAELAQAVPSGHVPSRHPSAERALVGKSPRCRAGTVEGVQCRAGTKCAEQAPCRAGTVPSRH